jgi:TolB-like protein/Tfp pilus assembly protein PilF/predicted Ser/Thr protein kinase
MSVPSGRRLGPYEILSPIGAGGMGEVLKARDTRLQRTVAIKVLPSELSSDAERRSRFEREAHAASALNHPNITTVFDIGEDEGTHYIVMELVEGKTLRELMHEGPLSTETMLPLATQIAEGLAKAHSAGIVHRDLKPENVMVTEDGLVKILDFGLAKLVPQGAGEGSEAPTETRVTQEGVYLGTVPYMSPEQAANRRLDYRSDQFSFGSILYEMATGKRAFKKDTVPETLAAIIEDEPEPIRKLNEAVPAELSVIVERCLAKGPAQRYESTGDLAKELKAVPEAPSPWRARRRVLSGTGAVVVVLLAAALGPKLRGLWDQLTTRAGPAPIESLAVLPLRNLSGDPEQEYFADGMTEALITDLAKLSGLKVIAPHSAMRYKGTDKPLAEVARELGVDALVEGSALRAGNSVRIMAQLIDPKTEQALWAESYERALENVLVLQGEVAQAIAGELAVSLTPDETRRMAAARPVNPEAYDAYLKGSFYWKTLTPEGLDTAERYFELALEKDPSYAPAYAGLAWVWADRQQMGITPPHEAGPKGKAAARRAIALDDSSAEAHGALGAIRTWTDWDWDGAGEAWRRALKLDPQAANAHAYFAHFLLITGRTEEAIRHSERAIELDPYNALFHALYAQVLGITRRHDDAMAAARTALAMDPGMGVAADALNSVFVAKGMRDEQLALQRERIAGNPELVAAFEQGLVEGGYEGAMRRVADLLAAWYEADAPRPGWIGTPASIAEFYNWAGDHERRMDWLEKGHEVRDPMLPYVASCPLSDPLRPDPRFQELLRKMNLPQAEVGS